MGEWSARCKRMLWYRDHQKGAVAMRLRGCVALVSLALASTPLAGQVNQGERTTPGTPSASTPVEQSPPRTSTTTPGTPTEANRSPGEPAQRSPGPLRSTTEPLRSTEPLRPSESPRLNEPVRAVEEIGRRPGEASAAGVGVAPVQRPCPGNAAASAAVPPASPYPGVSASQFRRAGVSADAFVRPGVSAAELATLQPGSRSAPCAAPRDVILYPDPGTPARRSPGGEQPSF